MKTVKTLLSIKQIVQYKICGSDFREIDFDINEKQLKRYLKARDVQGRDELIKTFVYLQYKVLKEFEKLQSNKVNRLKK